MQAEEKGGGGGGEEKKAECSNNIAAAMGLQNPGAFLRRTWVASPTPIRDSALRGHFMPPIASDTGTLSTTPGDVQNPLPIAKQRRGERNLI